MRCVRCEAKIGDVISTNVSDVTLTKVGDVISTIAPKARNSIAQCNALGI